MNICLNLNEYDFEHSEEFYNILKTGISRYNIVKYQNSKVADSLIEKLAKINDVNNENILLSNGSIHGLEILVRLYYNKKIFVFTPTYSYFDTLVHNLNVEYIPIDFTSNFVDIPEDIDFEDSVVYIVNPNNPTGKLINRNSLELCLKRFKKTIFIVDEAYIDYSIENTCLEFIKTYDNIIITRTFSKGYGLCGLRMGYIITKNTTNLKDYFHIHNLSTISLIAANYILDNLSYYKNIIDTIKLNRNDFENFLKEMNISYLKSEGNFITFYSNDELYNYLDINGVLIRKFNNFYRITIGQKENMEYVKSLIKEFYNK
jgi:histidinol-phosphate aminotransferase